MKSKKKRSDPAQHSPGILCFPRDVTMWRRVSPGLWLFLLAAWVGSARPATPQKQSKQEAIANQFLIYGNVFTEQGFALPGAEAKVRRTNERKQRWEAYSDRRGEFAVRVPRGDQYEIAIKAKGYTPLTRAVDARSGDREDMVFRMQVAAEGKKK